jgi:hypothetical protein
MNKMSDDYMREMLGKTKPYTIVILRRTQKRDEPGAEKVVWEHGRRNFELRRDGVLRIVCPVDDEGEIRGMGVFSTTPDETRRIMDEDPAVRAGIFTYQTLNARSFPGDSLS